MNKILPYILIMFISGCNNKEEKGSLNESHIKEKETISEYIIDTNNNMNNVGLEQVLNTLTSTDINSYKTSDSIPETILFHLTHNSKDSFQIVNVNEKYRLDDRIEPWTLTNEEHYKIPCRKINYLGITNNVAVLSYDNVCFPYNYVTIILIVEYSKNQIKYLWQGEIGKYKIEEIKKGSGRFIENKLSTKTEILNFLDSCILNEGDLHHRDSIYW